VKLSLNWLKEFVELPANVTAKQIMHDLTMCTVEVEKLHDIGAGLDKVIVGKIIEVNRHPNADKLKLVTTDLGEKLGTKVIVCGGSNLAAGMLVAVSLPGAMVNWHGAAELTEVKETKIRGELSFGMICASEEVGLKALFPAKDEAEIMDLTNFKVAPGTPLADALGINDTILEIDNKSLTNRPDLWGHIGMARELAAIYDAKLSLPELPDIKFTDKTSELQVAISDAKLCSRYSGLIVSNIKNTESPFALKARLALLGQRPISLVVDLTNIVMFALGQPTHAFDRKLVKGSRIEVRSALSKENLKLLDGKAVELGSENLVIADDSGAIGLAGVMGGESTAASDSTTEIIFEAANFYSMGIRKTASTFGIRTESSMRFEKALDPTKTAEASSYFMQLLTKHQPGVKLTAAVDSYLAPVKAAVIEIDDEFIRSRIGTSVAPEVVSKKLSALGFKVEGRGKYKVTAPTYRSTGDIKYPEDIVEELARMLGYDNLTYSPVKITLEKPIYQWQYRAERTAKETLAFNGGFSEVINYPWIPENFLKACAIDSGSLVKLLESPGPNCHHLRPTLIPGLLQIAQANSAHFDAFKIFELGPVFSSERAPFSKATESEKLPKQHDVLGLLVAGAKREELFFNLKGAIARLFGALGLEAKLVAGEHQVPNMGAMKVLVQGKDVGAIVIPSDKVLNAAGLKRIKVVCAELNFSEIVSAKPRTVKFTPLPKNQAVNFDVAMVFDETQSWEMIQRAALKSDNLIKSVQFMDLYRGDQIAKGKKSVALTLSICSDDKTLTADEINAIAGKAIKALNGLGGELRK
jgi:phenylalanyl-tRNA synthetase beta chain